MREVRIINIMNILIVIGKEVRIINFVNILNVMGREVRIINIANILNVTGNTLKSVEVLVREVRIPQTLTNKIRICTNTDMQS